MQQKGNFIIRFNFRKRISREKRRTLILSVRFINRDKNLKMNEEILVFASKVTSL